MISLVRIRSQYGEAEGVKKTAARIVGPAGAHAIFALAVCISMAASLQPAFGGDSPAAAPDYSGTYSAEPDDRILELPGFHPADSFTSDDVAEYQQSFRAESILPRQQYLDDGSGFALESLATRLLGIKVDGDVSELEGRSIEGVMIIAVAPDSPGAVAGFRGRRAALHHILDGVAIASSVFFPPAFFAVPLVEESQIGDSHDLIIGVDGERIHAVVDLEEALQKTNPGEIVYFNIIRGRRRLQIVVSLPQTAAPATAMSKVP